MINSEESRAGALACLNALRIIERLKPDEGVNDWWRNQESAEVAMIHAAQASDEFMSGFVAMVAEYALFINNTGMPDLYGWKPEATMSEEEKAAYRVEFGKEIEEMSA